jgi:DNA-binding transcriptional LysR family regulator
MELRQLRYFIAVAEELNFTRAAERCHIAQPPLSQQIMKLEVELGVTLFDRSNRRVSLTPEGQTFLCVARGTLDTLEYGVEQMRLMARGVVGRLRVGFLNSGIQTDFPKAITAFRRSHPGIMLDIREMESADQAQALRRGELDVGLAHHCQADASFLDMRTFMVDRYLLAVHEDHPLAARSSFDWPDIDGEPFIMFSRLSYPEAYDRALAVYRGHGVMPRIVQDAGTHQTKLALIAAGMGIGFVPERMGAILPGCVRMLPPSADDDDTRAALMLVWRKGSVSAPLQCFLDTMAGFCRESAGPVAG